MTLRVSLLAALAGTSLLAVDPALAMQVTYQWVPGYNSPTRNGGAGTITLDSDLITDPNNFSAIPADALLTFSYSWLVGVGFDSSVPYTLSVSNWTAQDGFLTSVFQISSTTAYGTFSLAGQPYNPSLPGFGTSFNFVDTIFGAELDGGYWQAPVPLPAAVWLLLSGLGGLFVAGRTRRRATSSP